MKLLSWRLKQLDCIVQEKVNYALASLKTIFTMVPEGKLVKTSFRGCLGDFENCYVVAALSQIIVKLYFHLVVLLKDYMDRCIYDRAEQNLF